MSKNLSELRAQHDTMGKLFGGYERQVFEGWLAHFRRTGDYPMPPVTHAAVALAIELYKKEQEHEQTGNI